MKCKSSCLLLFYSAFSGLRKNKTKPEYFLFFGFAYAGVEQRKALQGLLQWSGKRNCETPV